MGRGRPAFVDDEDGNLSALVANSFGREQSEKPSAKKLTAACNERKRFSCKRPPVETEGQCKQTKRTKMQHREIHEVPDEISRAFDFMGRFVNVARSLQPAETRWKEPWISC